jgi:hypothetical protein
MTSRAPGFILETMWRFGVPFLVLILLSGGRHDSGRTSMSTPGDAGKVDFGKQVMPILESRCQPCHFAGGKMYSKLPFDRSATIVTLGEKLFTRIKDEPSRAVIRRFLAEHKSPARRPAG